MTLNDSLTFYRNQLGQRAQFIYDNLYREIRNDISAGKYSFPVPESCIYSDCADAYHALIKDRPELYTLEFGMHMGIGFQKAYFANDKKFSPACASQISQKLQDFISNITAGLDGRTDSNKELAIYTRIVKIISYRNGEKTTHTILGPIFNHEGSCDGHAKIFALCLRSVGIPCITINNSDHMWNLATIDGRDVYIDCVNG